jgi:hypothetical protein
MMATIITTSLSWQLTDSTAHRTTGARSAMPPPPMNQDGRAGRPDLVHR